MENTCQNNADQLHRSGVSAWQNGDLKTALELVLKAIKADSNAPQYYNTFGVILAQAGRDGNQRIAGGIPGVVPVVSTRDDYQAALILHVLCGGSNCRMACWKREWGREYRFGIRKLVAPYKYVSRNAARYFFQPPDP